MPSGVLTFVRSNDALRCLCENIQSHRLLYDLCLVNRRFNTLFSTSLYRHVHIRSNNELKGLLGNTHLTHIRRLTITEGAQHWSSALTVNELAQQLLEKMQDLKAFTWIGIALATRTVQLLHQSCNKLKSIHVAYPAEIQGRLLGLGIADEEDQGDEDSHEARTLFRIQDFSAFANLEEVTFYNIYDDLSRWRRTLAKILKSSPRLRKLGLSLSTETIARAYHRGKSATYIDFFDRLCDEFGATGASTLQLQSLRCGSTIYPRSPASLEKLTDLSHLEEVHVQNASVEGEIVYLSMYEEDEHIGIAFDTFLSPACRNLRRFTAYQLRGDVFEALCNNTDVEWTRQLAISFECPDEGNYEIAQILTEDSEFPGLPLQVRMMDLDFNDKYEDEISDILDNLVSSNSETLEGLALHLPKHPTRHGSFAHFDLLQEAVGRLPKLTQIAMNLHESIHGRTYTAEQLNKVEAEKLASAAHHLQYVNICWSFWRIWRPIDGEGRMSLILISLNEWEREDVELFRHTIFKAS
ncbi:hypothetical protein BKA64DRAFT_33770 [Cadophora sp. MPI-SDFR-AT-0126]|nr:hypothetical protein BKA64DRAFT_33770 [Leotiomycetes sp. MPI-SDFR-AT-0126]